MNFQEQILDNIQNGYYQHSDNGIAHFKSDILKLFGVNANERFNFFLKQFQELPTQEKYKAILEKMPETADIKLPVHQLSIIYNILSNELLFRKSRPLVTDCEVENEQLKEACDTIHKILQIY